jgi:hypothetical protein
MGLLTPKGKKGDKKSGNNNPKNAGQQSKFLGNKSTKGPGGSTKGRMTGGANRGS